MATVARGMVRALDDLGRLVIPMEWRRLLSINPKDPMEMVLYSDGVIVVRPYRPGCAFCGQIDEEHTFVVHRGLRVCESCQQEISEKGKRPPA
jgi:transcriptional pleiotropic regulator of transition state genes